MIKATGLRRDDPELAALVMLALGLLFLRIRAASLTLRGFAATLLTRRASDSGPGGRQAAGPRRHRAANRV